MTDQIPFFASVFLCLLDARKQAAHAEGVLHV